MFVEVYVKKRETIVMPRLCDFLITSSYII